MAEPLSSNSKVFNDDDFTTTQNKHGFKIRVARNKPHFQATFERAIVGQVKDEHNGLIPAIVCQCDGTSRQVRSCVQDLVTSVNREDNYIGIGGYIHATRKLCLRAANDAMILRFVPFSDSEISKNYAQPGTGDIWKPYSPPVAYPGCKRGGHL